MADEDQQLEQIVDPEKVNQYPHHHHVRSNSGGEALPSALKMNSKDLFLEDSCGKRLANKRVKIVVKDDNVVDVADIHFEEEGLPRVKSEAKDMLGGKLGKRLVTQELDLMDKTTKSIANKDDISQRMETYGDNLQPGTNLLSTSEHFNFAVGIPNISRPSQGEAFTDLMARQSTFPNGDHSMQSHFPLKQERLPDDLRLNMRPINQPSQQTAIEERIQEALTANKGQAKQQRRRRKRHKKSNGRPDNTKIYLEKQEIQDYVKKQHGSEYMVQTATFMSRWTIFWIYFQVLYLILLMLTLIVATMIMCFDRIGYSAEELHQEYVIEQAPNYDPELGFVDESEYSHTIREISALTWLFRVVILAVLPSALLIYRSRLLSMTAFKLIKMHQGDSTGIAYSKIIQRLNYLIVIPPRLHKTNYIEYITFKNKNKHSYQRTGEYWAAFIIIVVIFFRLWSTEIEPFILPLWYIVLISLLLFQKQVVFLIKLSVFIPVSLLALIAKCCHNNDKKSHSERESTDSKQNQEESTHSSLRLSRVFKITHRFNLGLDDYESNTGQTDENDVSSDDSSQSHRRFRGRRFKHRLFHDSSYSCLCCMKLHMIWYNFQQLTSLLYHDRNTYIRNQTCEYCGEAFRNFEKIRFPLNCVNNDKPKKTVKSERQKAKADSQEQSRGPFQSASNPDVRASHAHSPERLSEKQQSGQQRKLRTELQRPHYYHVVCQDHIVQEAIQRITEEMEEAWAQGENVRKATKNKRKEEAAEHCLVCSQEKDLQDEEYQREQMRKKLEREREEALERVQNLSAPELFENGIAEQNEIEEFHLNVERINSEPFVLRSANRSFETSKQCSEQLIQEEEVDVEEGQRLPVKHKHILAHQPIKELQEEEASDRDHFQSEQRRVLMSQITHKEGVNQSSMQTTLLLEQQQPKR